MLPLGASRRRKSGHIAECQVNRCQTYNKAAARGRAFSAAQAIGRTGHAHLIQTFCNMATIVSKHSNTCLSYEWYYRLPWQEVLE